MAETIVITEEDRIEAENIMEQYLSDALTDGDFTKGGALRDLAIGAIAYTYAYMKKERDYVRARQSLLLLGTLSGTDVDDAVDEILSNWFITRKTGRESTGTATVYIGAPANSAVPQAVTVPTGTRFFKTSTLPFLLNSAISLSFSEDDFRPISDSSGEVVSYSFDIPLIAAGSGVEYDIDPGPFVDFTTFDSRVTRVENASVFSGGAGTESTETLLERAPTAVTVRDLNSARSIDTVLKEEFTTVDDVIVIGYGDAEMLRDLVVEEATNTRIHAGGHVDTYLRSPITSSKAYTAEIGAAFTDARPSYHILRDATIADFLDIGGAEVTPGDIIEIYNYLPSSEANRYIIKEVTNYGIYVSMRSPFPGIMPVVDGDFDDGEVETGNTEFKSAGHAFAEIEISYDDAELIGGTNQIESTEYTFSTSDVGKWIRVRRTTTPPPLIPSNYGTYKIHSITVAPDPNPGRAEVVDFTGTAATFSGETGLDWDLMTTTDLNKFVRIKNAATSSNNGTWKIVGIIDADYVELYDASGSHPTFTTETGLDWELCSRVVEYSVGKNPPHYNNKVSRRYTGQFTKTIQNDGRILLPGEPIYRITDVSFASSVSPYTVNGRVTFPHRKNVEPTYVDLGGGDPDHDEPSELEYQVIGHNPGEVFSGWQVLEVDVGWPDGSPAVTPELKSYFNGNQLRVTYDTLTGFDAIWTYMLSGDQRILCGSVIPKGLHPAYLHMNLNYRLAKTATEALDTTEAASGLASFINNFDTREDMDTSDIVAYLRENFSVIGYLEPATIYYDFLAPDGRVIYYKTTDRVLIDAEKIIDPDTDYAPYSSQPELLFSEPIALGVSDNTVRYLTVSDLITFTQQE